MFGFFSFGSFLKCKLFIRLLILLFCNATVTIVHKLFLDLKWGRGGCWFVFGWLGFFLETKGKFSLEKTPIKLLTANKISIFACLSVEGKLFAAVLYLLLSLSHAKRTLASL